MVWEGKAAYLMTKIQKQELAIPCYHRWWKVELPSKAGYPMDTNLRWDTEDPQDGSTVIKLPCLRWGTQTTVHGVG